MRREVHSPAGRKVTQNILRITDTLEPWATYYGGNSTRPAGVLNVSVAFPGIITGSPNYILKSKENLKYTLEDILDMVRLVF